MESNLSYRKQLLNIDVYTRGDDFTQDNLQSQHNIVPAKRDGVFI